VRRLGIHVAATLDCRVRPGNDKMEQVAAGMINALPAASLSRLRAFA
jgi:hypothetical protein